MHIYTHTHTHTHTHTTTHTLYDSVGDLTHAKYSGERYSRQFEEEWKVYGDVLTETGVRERHPWLDLRGNHGQNMVSYPTRVCVEKNNI